MTWHPALNDIGDDAWEAETSTRRSWQRFRDNREPPARWTVLGSGRCWCGEQLYHDWPGKADGAPHPRVAPDGLRPVQAPRARQGAAA